MNSGFECVWYSTAFVMLSLITLMLYASFTAVSPAYSFCLRNGYADVTFPSNLWLPVFEDGYCIGWENGTQKVVSIRTLGG